jgi:hypothetical protein
LQALRQDFDALWYLTHEAASRKLGKNWCLLHPVLPPRQRGKVQKLQSFCGGQSWWDFLDLPQKVWEKIWLQKVVFRHHLDS